MKEKKTEVITFRTSPAVKEKLNKEAEEKGWTISQLVERVIAKYAEENRNEPQRNHINIVNINQN